MGKFELTQEQYQQVTGTNPSHFKGRDLPVECVSWVEAQEFCRKAAEQTGQLVRLPSEAEWEYACRAGTTTRFSAGDANGDLESAAWFDANSGGTIHPVGQKKPNPWGLYDMPGNVWEWCADRHWSYRAEPATDPPGPLLGPTRVMRGGSWAHHLSFCRSANRDESNPDWRNYTLGFRVLVTLPKTP
jgi:formylglycine-generating enzyme required for sulfatase activity